jgi:hypothetical protein
MPGKQWIVELTTDDGLSFGTQVNYLVDIPILPNLVERKLSQIIVIRNQKYDPDKDDKTKQTYP